MAEKEISRTRRALQGKMATMDYWYQETGTVDYSLKLDALFSSTLELLTTLPRIGPLFDGKRDSICRNQRL